MTNHKGGTVKKAPKKAKRSTRAKPKQAVHNAHSDKVVAPVGAVALKEPDLSFPSGSFAPRRPERSWWQRACDFLLGKP